MIEGETGNPISPTLLAAVFDHAQDGMVLTESRLEAPGPKILAVNRSFEKMTGYPAQEAVGQTPRILQGPRTDRTVLARIRPTLARGQIFRGETFNYRKDGKEFLMSWYIAPILDQEATVSHYLGVQRDVTEQRRLEKLNSAIASVEDLDLTFAGLRHELGNPIGSLRSVLGLLRDHSDDLDRRETQEYLASMSDEVERMAALLDDLRNYNLLTPKEPVPVPIDHLLRDLRQTLITHCKVAGVELKIQKNPTHHEGEVLCDLDALRRVVLNLVLNSIDAVTTRDQPTILIEATYGGPGMALLRVTDNGVGIPASERHKLFRPFHSTKSHGTGLGLVMSRRLITAMGGALDLNDADGGGTVARVTIPWVPAQSPHQISDC